MNFLAHAYLSFNNPDIMAGNFIADFVKGSDYNQYPEAMKQGILLHRDIDHFTDQHEQVRESKSRLYGQYRHYAAVIVDMYYDHFLAANFHYFHHTPLPRFTHNVYETVSTYRDKLPEKAERILYYMSRGNWLLSYARIKGIEQALNGIGHRTRFESGLEKAGHTLRSHYRLFHQEFMIFFPKAIAFARQQIREL